MSDTQVKILIFLVIFLNLSDMLVTLWVLESGIGTEANPIMKYFLDLGVHYFVLVKIMAVSVACFIFWLNRKLKFAIIGLYVTLFSYIGLNLYFCLNLL
tara:strand:+ start:1439 stop:1735 length:297 start_codon:yes stop_codon:yes gene_type:complete